MAGPAPTHRSEWGNVVLVNHCEASPSITTAVPPAYNMSQRRATGSAAICSGHWYAMFMMCLCAGRRIQGCVAGANDMDAAFMQPGLGERGIHALCRRGPQARGWPGGAGGRVVHRMQRGISVYTGLLNVKHSAAVSLVRRARFARGSALLRWSRHLLRSPCAVDLLKHVDYLAGATVVGLEGLVVVGRADLVR